MGLAGMAVLLTGCKAAESTVASDVSSAIRAASGAASSAAGDTAVGGEECVEAIPEETVGPFPADGSRAGNTSLNALALAGIVRSDIRTSLGTNNTTQGIPCNFELTLVDSSDGCTPLADYALYIWHCDRGGNYSMYSSAAVIDDVTDDYTVCLTVGVPV
jgi:protocatechuate 3,4-dioxygenase beta subunit